MNDKHITKDFFSTISKIVIAILLVTLIFTGKINPVDIVGNNSIPTISQDVAQAAIEPWNANIAPDFITQAGSAQFSELALSLKPGEEHYTTDELGRPQESVGNITYTMYKEGSDRERDNLPNPIGWPKNQEVTINFPKGGTYHGWLWNRSHLLAKSLGGDDIKDNLVAGTRCQNVGKNDGDGGMAYPETLARTWLSQHKDGTLLYSARPIYVDEEKIPRSVIVDMKSSDNTINNEYIVYNAAPGFTIDYQNSTWSKDGVETTTTDFGAIFQNLFNNIVQQ